MTNETLNEHLTNDRTRVEKELSELLDKIAKLTIFLHQDSLTKKGLSMRMIATMYTQLTTMTDYARLLQYRLAIWGKTDEELAEERESGESK